MSISNHIELETHSVRLSISRLSLLIDGQTHNYSTMWSHLFI